MLQHSFFLVGGFSISFHNCMHMTDILCITIACAALPQEVTGSYGGRHTQQHNPQTSLWHRHCLVSGGSMCKRAQL